MNLVLVFLWSLSLIPTAFSQGALTEVNPKTFFKPDLNRVDRARTGFVIRTSRAPALKSSLNNPFLSRNHSNRPLLSHSFRVRFRNQEWTPNQYGKVELRPVPPGFHQIEWSQKDLHRSLFLPIQSSETWLLEFFINEEMSPYPSVLVGKSELQTLPNPELNQLNHKLIRVQEILEKIVEKRFDPAQFLADSYEDEMGKREDFIAFLEIKFRSLEAIDFASCELMDSQDSSRLYLSGRMRDMNQHSSYFFLRLEMIEDFKVRRYELVSSSLVPDP